MKDYLEPGVLEKDIKPTIDFILESRFPGGNFPSSIGRERDRSVQWCHGAPGFIHLFVSAARVTNSYDACLRKSPSLSDLISRFSTRMII